MNEAITNLLVAFFVFALVFGPIVGELAGTGLLLPFLLVVGIVGALIVFQE